MMRIFLAACLLLLLANCSPNNVKQDDSLGKFFKEENATGCFALLDNGTGQFTIYNLPAYRDSNYLPVSTFKIVNALIGLQTGKISSENMVIKWDGVKRPFDSWNKDLTMTEAFKVSAVPYFQEVARRIGKDTMQRWLDSLSYGTEKISSAVDIFWLDNSLKIKPDEQLGLVKKLYFDQLPFFKTYQEKVKAAMLAEANSNYQLSYKTGWGFYNEKSKKHQGWAVGWVVENSHPYFFVLYLESADPGFDMISKRVAILKSILSQLGFLKGTM